MPLVALISALIASATPAQEPVSAEPTQGVAYVGLLGDYVGRLIRVSAGDDVLVEERLTFPPPGASHRYDLPLGPARTVSARVEIEDCPSVWTGEVRVEPRKTSPLLIQGRSSRNRRTIATFRPHSVMTHKETAPIWAGRLRADGRARSEGTDETRWLTTPAG